MKWTNKHDLPLPIYNAIVNSDYSKEGSDFSVTELSMSAQERRLFRLHHTEIEKDIVNNIWALLGSSMHYILEKASGTSDSKLLAFREGQIEDIKALNEEFLDLLEEGDAIGFHFDKKLGDILSRQPAEINSHLMIEDRQWGKIANRTVSGQVDVYNSDTATIQDYKVTGVWKYQSGDIESWKIQLNIYRYLLIHNNHPVRKLEVIGIFKDWKGYEAFKDNYPDAPIKVIDLPIMDDIDVLQYILDRIRIHSEASRYNNAKELAKNVPCTDKERWAKIGFSIKKVGGKIASKTCDTFAEANLWVVAHPKDKYIITDKSEYKKCAEYCDVAQFCAQYNTKSVAPTEPPNINLDDVLPEKVKSTLAELVKDAPKSAMSTLDKIKAKRLLKEKADATPVVVEEVKVEGTIATTEIATVEITESVNKEASVDSLFDGSEDLGDALDKLGL
jgi:hypothetical protein